MSRFYGSLCIKVTLTRTHYNACGYFSVNTEVLWVQVNTTCNICLCTVYIVYCNVVQHHVLLSRRCRRSDSTRSRRCQRQCRPSWRWVECRVCWARTSCLTDGSCTSHRSPTDGTSSYIADDNPLGACLSLCRSSSVLHDSATPNLRAQPAMRRVWSFHCQNYEWHRHCTIQSNTTAVIRLKAPCFDSCATFFFYRTSNLRDRQVEPPTVAEHRKLGPIGAR